MIKITRAKGLQFPDFPALIKIVFIKDDSWLLVALALLKGCWFPSSALGAGDPESTVGRSSLGNDCAAFTFMKPQTSLES